MPKFKKKNVTPKQVKKDASIGKLQDAARTAAFRLGEADQNKLDKHFR
jgi:hypothetical protein